MKIIAFSDIHIPYTNKKFLSFVDYALDEADLIVGVGDIIDRVRCTEKEIMESKTGPLLLKALKKLILSGKCYLLKGNHDPDLDKTIQKLLGISCETPPYFIINNIFFTHGYQFDAACSWAPWRFLKKIAPWFFKPPSHWKQYNRKKWHKSIGAIYSNVFGFAEHHTYNLIVIGHTHYAGIMRIESGQIIADCGDWLDSCTYIKLDNGQLDFKKWDL
ncbi:MAG TPA: hypothetical protein ENI51_09810 [Candidatus Atribacteria bacterium]|nr:hypothetical protein [Candidatus Atribacteria bacterium]